MFDQNPNQVNTDNQVVEDILAGTDDRPVLKEVISSNSPELVNDVNTGALAHVKIFKIILFGVVVPSVVLAGGFVAYKFVPKNEKKIIEKVAPITDKIITPNANKVTNEVTDISPAVTEKKVETEVVPVITETIIDYDQDGLSDTEERTLLTNPNKIDTDGDGLSDYEEVKKYQTDPLVMDTDGDTYSDGAEVNKGYNPKGAGKLNLVD